MLKANARIQPADLGFFATLAACGSLSAAARELGITTPAVSKRLAQMEARLGVALPNRTTRRTSLTPEGEQYLQHARRILSEIDDLAELLGSARAEPRGLLRVNATLGFGRRHVAPAVSRFVRRYPQVEVRLQLSASPPPLTEDAYDVCIRFGAPSDARVIARRLAAHRRVPKVPADLARHNCITIRQGDDAFGVWRLTGGRGPAERTVAIKVRGKLTSNDGEVAVHWALDGHGILMRSEWDIAHYLRSGRLVQVLGAWRTPDADIYAVYPQRHQWSAHVRAFVDFMAAALASA